MRTLRSAPCLPEAELHDAFTDRASSGTPAHVRACPACSTKWEALSELAGALRDVPPVDRSEVARAESRRLVLHRARSAEPPVDAQRWRRWALVGLATVAAAVGLAVALLPGARDVADSGEPRRSPVPVNRGHVHAAEDARFTIVRGAPDEVVRVFDGSVTLSVDPLRPGERFRVLVGDSEVEVHGTVFDVTAVSDRLTAVRVSEGLVEVRPEGQPGVTLSAGDRWAPTAPSSPSVRNAARQPGIEETAVSTPSPPSLPRRVPGREPTTADPTPRNGAVPDDSETAFQEGWTALREAEHSAAAEAFARVDPSSPMAEDAAFWHAVALGRAGRDEAATRAFEAYLARHPRSARRGEATVSLGWLHLRQGRRDQARARFEEAGHDTDSTVRLSAQRGLRALPAGAP